MSPDEWQTHVTREAALDIARWLEARGRLHGPIASLSLGDLEAMADSALSRWIVLPSRRLQAPRLQSPGLQAEFWPPEDRIATLLLG